MRIRPFDRGDTDVVVALWHEVGITRPWNDPHRDIERKMTVQPELFLVGVVDSSAHDDTQGDARDDAQRDGEDHGDEVVVATAMSGFDGHRGWLYYFAVSPAYQGAGLGHTMLREVERLLVERGCPKLNVQIRGGAQELIERYEQWGYAQDGATGMGKRLIPD